MLKKMITAMLGILIFNLGVTASFGAATDPDIQKVKQQVAKIGTGPDAKIEVKLKDGTKVKGYVSEIGNDQFVVTDAKSGVQTPVPYPQVQKAKSHRGWILFAVGIAAVVIIAVVAVKSDK